MAGTYPDAPSRRMAWDDDGTQAWFWHISGSGSNTDGRTYDVNSPYPATLNDESNNQAAYPNLGDNSSQKYFGMTFPELREFDGFFIVSEENMNGGTLDCGASDDSIDGRAGSWTTVVADYTAYTSVVGGAYRNNITTVAESLVRSIRFRTFAPGGGGSSLLTAVHVYGRISPGETPDRLFYVDASSGLQFLLPIDYGDLPRGSADDRLIKLRNNSSTQTAGTIQITAEDLYLTMGDWFTFSEDGQNFAGSLLLASSIGPGADSPTITARRVTGNSETVGAYAARFQTSVASWT